MSYWQQHEGYLSTGPMPMCILMWQRRVHCCAVPAAPCAGGSSSQLFPWARWTENSFPRSVSPPSIVQPCTVSQHLPTEVSGAWPSGSLRLPVICESHLSLNIHKTPLTGLNISSLCESEKETNCKQIKRVVSPRIYVVFLAKWAVS